MKIEIINHRSENQIIEVGTIYVYDGEGNQYRMCLDKFGELMIQSSDSGFIIEPHVSDEIILKQTK
jgi:hypothetical protein